MSINPYLRIHTGQRDAFISTCQNAFNHGRAPGSVSVSSSTPATTAPSLIWGMDKQWAWRKQSRFSWPSSPIDAVASSAQCLYLTVSLQAIMGQLREISRTK